MSLNIDAKVVWKPLNNCLIALPSSFIYPILDSTNLLVQQIIVKLSNSKTEDHIVTLGWNGNTSSDLNSIEIDSQYAKVLKIADGSSVRVDLDLQTIRNNTNGTNVSASSVEIEPETTSDWELTEIYAQAIEANFLSQVRCVSKNQILLIRANPTASGSSSSGLINFRVKTIKTLTDEVNFATIGNNTELHIIPKPHKSEQNQQKPSHDQTSTGSRKKRSVSSKKTDINSNSVTKRSIINFDGSNLTVYNKGPKLVQFKNIEYVQVSVIEGPGTPAKARKTTSKEIELGISKETFGRKIVARYVESIGDDLAPESTEDDEDIFNEVHRNSFLISPLLAISLGLENTCGEIICIEPCNRKCVRLDMKQCDLYIHKLTSTSDEANRLNADNKLELNQETRNEKKLEQLEWRKEISGVLKQILVGMYGPNTPLTDGMKLPIVEHILPEGAILEISSETSKSLMNNKKQNINSWILLNSIEETPEDHSSEDGEEHNNEFKLEFGKDKLVPISRIQKEFGRNELLEIFGQEKKMENIKQFLYSGLPTFLYGKSGSGKSLVCSIIENEFNKNGYYTRIINFDHIGTINDESKNKNEEDSDDAEDDDTAGDSKKDNNKNKLITNIFEKALRKAVWHSPSLIILENLDKVLTKEVEHGDSASSSQLTEILMSKAEKYCTDNNITFLITAKSRDSINKAIFQKHFVDEEVGLEAPNKIQLSEILQKMVSNKFPEYVDASLVNYLTDVTSELEGYLPLDLENLLDRAFHHMITEDREKFEFKDFISAIEGYTPTSLRGVKLQKATTSWSNIGGLLAAKKILLETLEWPTKYAPIFDKCTLRLRSGILLYGYPGCGKTMLASAISSQCGLNFISVKGPEILNKYIGASEQSVRELFERAQSAKPCILFFDEFDSIAPKRGHDSTGVTDRIVNQLLTQMDGAEGLEGVYVLAATSRPDLIDSALLRPGRLDKSVICDLPDFENRLDILKTIVKSNGFYLQDDNALKEIAQSTKGYTGADLQAVVYNAYLKAVHEKLESETESSNANEVAGNNQSDEVEYKIISADPSGIKRFKNTDQTRKKVETLVENYKALFLNKFCENIDNNEVEADPELELTGDGDKIFISLENLNESLSETKKSISVKELEKLENIYAQFESSKRPSEMKDGEGSTEVGVRASLM